MKYTAILNTIAGFQSDSSLPSPALFALIMLPAAWVFLHRAFNKDSPVPSSIRQRIRMSGLTIMKEGIVVGFVWMIIGMLVRTDSLLPIVSESTALIVGWIGNCLAWHFKIDMWMLDAAEKQNDPSDKH